MLLPSSPSILVASSRRTSIAASIVGSGSIASVRSSGASIRSVIGLKLLFFHNIKYRFLLSSEQAVNGLRLLRNSDLITMMES